MSLLTNILPNQTIFVSDIHLCESRPNITDAFVNFLNKMTSQVDALFILGDLFEYWIGDDSSYHENVISALKSLVDRHIKVFLMIWYTNIINISLYDELLMLKKLFI